MKKLLATLVLFLTAFSAIGNAQVLDEVTLAKRAARRNLTIKEWNTDPKTKTRTLDNVVTYDDQGRKVEEIEYNVYGMKWREVYEYGANGRIVKDVRYNEKGKPTIVRKYEYNADGTKKKQYNYGPDGRLQHVKVFEYIIPDE